MVEVLANIFASTHLDHFSVLANKVTSYRPIASRAVDLSGHVFVQAAEMEYAERAVCANVE